jgi:hypothetical protein
MVFDHTGMTPNPARDRVIVKLTREDPEEPNPPSAEQVEAVYWTLPSRHQLALLFLDWSCARVSAIDKTRVGDYDCVAEANARLQQLEKAHAKQKQAEEVATTAMRKRDHAEREALRARGELGELRERFEIVKAEADAQSDLNARVEKARHVGDLFPAS